MSHTLLDEERDEFLDIYRAARRGDAEGLAALLTNEDSVNTRFTNGNTPLIWVARLGLKDAAQLLLKNGADIEAVNTFGATALSEAVEKDKVDVAELLIADEANPNVVDNAGNTPLMLGARNGHHELISRLWEGKRRPDLEMRNADGCTALMWAAMGGHVKAVRILLASAAAVDEATFNRVIMATDNDGLSVLAIAARTGQEPIMKAVIEQVLSSGGGPSAETADAAKAVSKAMQQLAVLIASKDKRGNTALMWAIRNADQSLERALDCCKVLLNLESGLEAIDHQNDEGDTALFWAASCNQIEICKYLIEKNATKSHTNKHDMTAEFIAQELGLTEVSTLLKGN